MLLTLSTTDGHDPGAVRTDLAVLAAGEAHHHVAALSTRARLDQLVHDFGRHAAPGFAVAPVSEDAVAGTSTVACTLARAMEFLTREDYTDSWVSECRERFTDMTPESWQTMLEGVGFELDPAARSWRNDWIVTNRIAPVASLADPDGTWLPRPATHVLVVARRPEVEV